MSRVVVAAKFVGTIGLGLLTGLSYTLNTTTLPPLLALPSSTPAHNTFTHLLNLSRRQQFSLSSVSASALVIAYALSPRSARHPYLLWSTLAVGLGYGSEIYAYFFGGGDDGKGKGGKWGSASRERKLKGLKEGSWTEDEEWREGSLEEGELNGEKVREGMEGWRVRQGWKAGVWGLGFGMCVVGIWGEGA